MSQKFIVRFWLIVSFLAAVLVFLVRANLNRDYQDLERALGIAGENLSYELMPPRRAYLGVDTKEMELRATIGPAFSQFSRQDWDDLWQIVYGVYPEPAFDNERLPRRITQLSVGEIQQELIRRFEYPFANFSPQHWQEFWKILKIKK